MVVQYPHTIKVTLAQTLVQDGSGNFSVPTGNQIVSDCRAEKASATETVTGVDGQALHCQFVVYLPVMNVDVPFESAVEITLENGSIFNGFVKARSFGQLNSRLWV